MDEQRLQRALKLADGQIAKAERGQRPDTSRDRTSCGVNLWVLEALVEAAREALEYQRK